MLKYGLIGWPVSHSLSPSIHNPAFKDKELDANYELVECPPENIEGIVADLKSKDFKGWNCTVPLKADIIPLLDKVDEEALACQSVNTVVVQPNGELHAKHGRHAMCTIGYDDKKFGGAFEIQNSWGTRYGKGGFIWIRYKDFGEFVYNAIELIPAENHN